jgi:predicted nucleotidyltransferase
MDTFELSRSLIPIVALLEESNLTIDAVVLFGSHAKGTATAQSDIDLAFISRDFGKDRIAEGALLSQVLYQKIQGADPVPVSLIEFLDPQPLSPILAEIKKSYIPLL